MRKIDLILLFKNFLSQEGRKQEDYSDEIKDFLEYLNEKHNHFNHKNDEMSPEVYIEIGDFIEAEDIKLIIIKLTDLFIQFDNESENKLCKNDVIEKIKLFQRIVSDKFQKNPSNNEHIQLLLEKITLNIQLKSIQSVNASNFSPHTIIFVSTNTFNSLSEDFAKRIYYNNKTHAKNPKYPSEEEFVNNWHLKKIGLVQFISKKDLQNELIILPENSRCIIITDCLNWNKGNSKLVNLKNQNNEYILSQIKNFCFIKTDSPQINQNFLQEAKNKKVGVFNFNSIINIQSKSQRTTLNSSIKRNFKVQEFIKKRNPKRYLTNVLLPPSMSFYVPQIIFIDGNINLWNEYYQICIDFEIPYLVSIQFRNLLNVCFTYEIGDEIISCLKSQNSSINLPASFSEQWQSLNDIQKEELLKSLKVLICDIVNIHGNIYHNFEKSTRILVPKLVYESEKLKVKISKFLKIKKEHIINWGSDYSRGKIISFDYRDIGIIKYPIKPPNIFETNHLQISDVCLVSYLFENKLHFGQYNFNNLIINELDNEYRRDKFKWEDLINEVKKIKPKNIDKTDYEFEEKVQREIEMDYYEVKFTHNGKVFKRQFNEYSKFLVNDTCGYEIEDLEGIKNKESIEILPLDELLDELNMQEFNLENDEVIKKSNEFKKKYLQNDLLKIDAQIWKILLKEKSKVIGNEVLYKELKDKCNLHGFDIVSYNTFLNAWINFDSESNRTSYRHLKILCEYLDLEKEYRYFLRVYCKTEANKARQSTIFHTEIINTLILPKLKNDENLNVFQLTENQKSSLILMGISEDNIQEKLNCYLEETKNIISKRTKKLINISKI